jgi:hypothetical protein
MKPFARGLVALAGVACAASVGRAERSDPGSRCSAAAIAWIARAAQSIGAPAAPIECRPGGVRVRLSPSGASPIDVEVAEPPGPAFAHAGRLRVSPVVEGDYAELPQPQREAFERFRDWLEANQKEITLTVGSGLPLPARTARGIGIRWCGPWLWLTAVVLLVGVAMKRGVTRGPDRDRRSDFLVAAALGLLAAILRLALGTWGPLHVNGQGPAWVSGALDPSALAHGPGYAELFGPLLHRFSASPDYALFTANAFLSAALAPLAFTLGRVLGLDRARAGIAAVLLAVDPVAVRIAATESYFAPIAVLVLAAELAFVRVVTLVGARRLVAAALLGLAGTFFCAQAARIHPVAWIPVALAPAIVFAAPAPDSWRRRAAIAAGLFALVGAVVAITSLDGIAERIGEGTRLYASGWPSLGAALLVVLGAVVVLLVARPRSIAAVAVAHAVALLATRATYAQSSLWEASYDRLFVIVPLLAIAAAIPASFARRRAMLAVVASGAALLLVCSHSFLRRRTTEQLEYRWLRAQLARLPPSCRVAYVQRAGRRVLNLPDYLMPPSRATTPPTVDASDSAKLLAAKAAGCVWYLRSSLCTSIEGRPACGDVERRLSTASPVTAAFPPLPSYDDLPYDRPIVEVQLSQIQQVEQ